MKTTTLHVQQWLLCTAVALSVVVAAEIRKSVLRRTAAKAIQPARPPADRSHHPLNARQVPAVAVARSYPMRRFCGLYAACHGSAWLRSSPIGSLDAARREVPVGCERGWRTGRLACRGALLTSRMCTEAGCLCPPVLG